MGAKSTSKTEIPAYMEEAGQYGLDKAKELDRMGYVPYMGPEVAMYDPTAATTANQGLSAFGLGTLNTDPMAGVPTASAGGMTGYSSFPVLEQAQQALAAKYPGLYDYLTNMFIDPVTGAMTGNAGQVSAEQAAQVMSTKYPGYTQEFVDMKDKRGKMPWEEGR